MIKNDKTVGSLKPTECRRELNRASNSQAFFTEIKFEFKFFIFDFLSSVTFTKFNTNFCQVQDKFGTPSTFFENEFKF